MPAAKTYTKENMNTNQLGRLTEVEVMTYVLKQGYSVSIPFGDKDRYDQIWDINGNLYRIQVKTCHLCKQNTGTAIEFKTTSISNGRRTLYTKNDIDYFATYWENRVYVVPVGETSSQKILRFEATYNASNISWAKDYTFEEVFKV